MITLLASIAGFAGSLIPEIFKIVIDKNDKKHELEIMDRQMSLREKSIDSRLEEISNYSDVKEMQTLYSTYKSGVFIVDIINASVRPLLAYAFFALYAMVKYYQFEMILGIDDYKMVMNILWNQEDQAIFAGIISFYFGQRAMNRKYINK